MNKRILITQMVAPSEVVRLRCSQAANNFCLNLNSALKPSIHIILKPIFVKTDLQVEDYENQIPNTKFFISQNRIKVNYFNSIIEPLYSVIFDSLKIIKKVKTIGPCPIWIYNITPHTLIVFWALKLLLRRKVYIIVADLNRYPGFTIWDIIAKTIKKSDGYIALSEHLPSYLPHYNREVIQGITSNISVSNIKNDEKINTSKFLFSGSLAHHSGILMALDVFKELPECELHISGMGEYEEQVMNAALNFPNIIFHQNLNYDEYKILLDSIDICLSLRDPKKPENMYNFPSKLIELATYEKIIISTIKYLNFDERNCIIGEYDVRQLVSIIRNISAGNEDEKIENIRKNIKDVNKLFTHDTWLKKILKIENYAR